MDEHRSCDGYPVEIGSKFWDNDLKVVEVTAVAAWDNPYADTGETQTWHETTDGHSDTLSGRMQPYGRLVRFLEGKDAENFAPGTRFADVK